MSRDLIIVGAGGFGREVRWLAEDCGKRVLGFLDDRSAIGSPVGNVRVLGPVQHWRQHAYAEFVIAVTDPRKRRDIARRMAMQGQPQFASLIHPSVKLPQPLQHGEGLIMAARCSVPADVVIGRHVILDRRVAVGSGCDIRDFCTISPAALLCGGVHLAGGVQVDAGACVSEGVRLESGSRLGSGAVLGTDAERNHLLSGCPAQAVDLLPPFEEPAATWLGYGAAAEKRRKAGHLLQPEGGRVPRRSSNQCLVGSMSAGMLPPSNTVSSSNRMPARAPKAPSA